MSQPVARLLGTALLDEAVSLGRASPRQRKNLNFHPADDYPAHRLLNAIEPGSYIAPHRHLSPDKDETMLVLRGRLGLVTFDDAGKVIQTAVLSPSGCCELVRLSAACARPSGCCELVRLSAACARPSGEGGENFGVDIPHGVWHTVLALEKGTVFFEAKGGPYLPLGDDERAPWAPQEGDAGAAAFQKQLLELL